LAPARKLAHGRAKQAAIARHAIEGYKCCKEVQSAVHSTAVDGSRVQTPLCAGSHPSLPSRSGGQKVTECSAILRKNKVVSGVTAALPFLLGAAGPKLARDHRPAGTAAEKAGDTCTCRSPRHTTKFSLTRPKSE